MYDDVAGLFGISHCETNTHDRRRAYGTSHSKLHDVRRSTESCQMTVRVSIDDRLGWVLVGDRSLYYPLRYVRT